MGSLKRATMILSLCLTVIMNKLTYAVNMGWDKILLLEIYGNNHYIR